MLLEPEHSLMLNYAYPLEINEKWVPVQNQHFTAGYLLFKSGLDLLLSIFRVNNIYVADSMTWTLQRYGYFPYLCIQENLNSDVQSQEKSQGVKSSTDNNISEYRNLYKFET